MEEICKYFKSNLNLGMDQPVLYITYIRELARDAKPQGEDFTQLVVL